MLGSLSKLPKAALLQCFIKNILCALQRSSPFLGLQDSD